MRQRMLSSLAGLVILGLVLFFFDTLVLNAAMCFIGVAAVLELLSAVKCIRFKSLSVLSVAIAVAIPFAQEGRFRVFMPQIMFLLVVILFIILLYHHSTLRVEQAAMMFFFSIFVPIFFSSAVFIRNRFGSVVGGVYVLWALGSAWLADSGAYFTGTMIGKRKLAPNVSPKKTVEGSLGGIAAAMALMPLIAFLYSLVMSASGTPVAVNYPLMIGLTPLFAVMGMLGDLSASVIKRQFGVKDFGNIMPGHGGILDRFDSVLFTLPAVFIAVEHLAVAVPL